MSSKGAKIAFWVVTIFIAGMMLFSAYGGAMMPQAKQAFAQLGYTNAGFRYGLSVAKFLGAIVLLVPFAGRLKEWAYFGFFVDFVAAEVSNIAAGMTSTQNVLGPIVAVVLLVISYLLYRRIYMGASTL